MSSPVLVSDASPIVDEPLTNRFNLDEDTASRILEDGFTQEEIVDALVTETPGNGTDEASTRTDGSGSSTTGDASETNTGDDTHV